MRLTEASQKEYDPMCDCFLGHLENPLLHERLLKLIKKSACLLLLAAHPEQSQSVVGI